ncbi:MAG: hypothetical protein CBC13_06750 [Planctomycetia bacterium TMED53]|nr:MAG: hypothetical protein CBC13_06750 [Planctomycetia bacterium TMED53]
MSLNRSVFSQTCPPASSISRAQLRPRTGSGTCALLLLGFFAIFLLLPVSSSEAAAIPDPDGKVGRVVDRHAGGDMPKLWRGATELERLGDDYIGEIQGLLGHENTGVILMGSKALLSLGETAGVRDALLKLVSRDDLDTDRRKAALFMVGEFRDKKTTDKLRGMTESFSGNPDLRIELGRTLYRVTGDRSEARALLQPLLTVDNPEARTGAALALAELGLIDGDVKRVLRSIELEPSRQGVLARLLLEQDNLLRAIENDRDVRPPETESEKLVEADRQMAAAQLEILALEKTLDEKDQQIERLQRNRGNRGGNHPLLDELLQRIERFYVDPSKVEQEELITAAAKGMVSSLDPFSSFMDVEDTKDFYEGISGVYAGIGAQVQKDLDTDTLKIIRPIYKGPAYREGLISDDLVVEVDGIPTKGKPLDEIVQGLKGNPGTPVTLKVFRRGWKEARDFVVTRETIQLDSVLYQMLPGDLGYVSLAQFGDTAVTEVFAALDDLESQGMKALILDLRSNPGGYLESAVKLVDEFVDDTSMPIVSQKSKSGIFEDSERFATEGKRADYPMVVLINESSASASEIVSGAFQDFKRAKLIGQKTYGKGSVQRLLPMSRRIQNLLGGESTLRLTVQRYYLPNGRSIHTERDSDGKIVEEGGVNPDDEVELAEIPLWRAEAIGKMIDEEAFKKWIDKYANENEELIARIVREGTGENDLEYPGFDDWISDYQETGITEEDARRGLRNNLRRREEDRRGQQFACDYVEDLQLQSAIIDLLGQLGTEVSTIPQYNRIEKVTEEETEEKAESL